MEMVKSKDGSWKFSYDVPFTKGMESEKAKEFLDDFIEKNLGLVYAVAKPFKGLSFYQELISEGSIGLIRATQTYDKDLSTFGYYSYGWIKSYILSYVNKDANFIKLPHSVRLKIKKYEQSDDVVTHLLAENLSLMLTTVSENDFKDYKGDVIFEDIFGTDQYSPSNMVENDDIVQIVAKHISKLPDSECHVMTRYLLFGDDLSLIASGLKITRQRVHQIKENGMKKLKGIPELNDLYF